MLNLTFTCLQSAQVEVPDGQKRGRGWPEKLIIDTMAVLVEGCLRSLCRERGAG